MSYIYHFYSLLCIYSFYIQFSYNKTGVPIYIQMKKWQPTPVFLPGKFHGQRSLAGYSPWGRKESYMTDQLSTHTCTRLQSRKSANCTLRRRWKNVTPHKWDFFLSTHYNVRPIQSSDQAMLFFSAPVIRVPTSTFLASGRILLSYN